MSYAFSIADRMLPFRDLLKPDTQFTWNDELQTLFEAFKRLLATCLLQTGPRHWCGCCRNTARVMKPNHFTVQRAGRSLLRGADSHMPQSLAMHQLKVNHWQLPTP